MAKPTKTKYYDDVVVVSTNGGYEYVLGMTLPELTIDVCGRSHPFYTGKETLIDTTGRIDRFQARLSAMNQKTQAVSKDKSKKARKFKQTLADLNEGNQPAAETKPAKTVAKKKVVEAKTENVAPASAEE